MSKNSIVRIFITLQTIHWFAIGLIIPILSLMILKKGHDISQVGICLGLYAGMTLLFELPTGGLADSIGRKTVNVISLFVLLFAFISLTLSEGILSFYFSFSLLGASRALSSGTLDAWFVEALGVEDSGKLQKAFALHGVFITLGLGAGSFLGGALPSWVSDLSSIYEGFNEYTPSLLLAIMITLINTILTLVLVKDDFEIKKGGLYKSILDVPTVISAAFVYSVKHRNTFKLIIISSLFGITSNSLQYLWQPQVEIIMGDHFQTWYLGVIGAGYFVFGAIGSYLAMPTKNIIRGGSEKIAFIMRFISGLCILGVALSPDLTLFTAFFWGYFLTNCIVSPYHSTLFNQNIPTDKRSSLLSLESFSIQLGGLLGSIALGYLAKETSLLISIMVGGIVILFSSFLYLTLTVEQRKLPS